MANPVETLVGPLLIMVLVACMSVLRIGRFEYPIQPFHTRFYGVYMAQAYFYWTTYTNDPVYMKTIVILVT